MRASVGHQISLTSGRPFFTGTKTSADPLVLGGVSDDRLYKRGVPTPWKLLQRQLGLSCYETACDDAVTNSAEQWSNAAREPLRGRPVEVDDTLDWRRASWTQRRAADLK